MHVFWYRLEVSLEQKNGDSLTSSITKLQSLETGTQSPPRPPKGAQTSPPPRPPKDTCIHPPSRPPKPMRGAGEMELEGGAGNSQIESRHKQKIKFKVLDGDAVGDYERSPSYKCSSTVVRFPSTEAVASIGQELNSSQPARSEHKTETLNKNEQPPLNSIESNGVPDNLESKYCGNYERSPDYHWCTGSGLSRASTDSSSYQRASGDYQKTSADSQRNDNTSASGGSNYSRATDNCHRGSADSSTSNQRRNIDGEHSDCTAVLTGKYRGDYERDPNYMRWQLAQQDAPTINPLFPHCIPHPQEVLEGRLRIQSEGCGSGRSQTEDGEECGRELRTDKYRGDYDRCETYTFPPSLQLGCKAGEGGSRSCDPSTGITWFRGKYVGNYERDPVYMKKLNHHFFPGADPGTSEHPYTTLETTTRQPLLPYSAITHQNSSLDSTPQQVINSQLPPDPSLQLVANHQQHCSDITRMPYADV